MTTHSHPRHGALTYSGQSWRGHAGTRYGAFLDATGQQVNLPVREVTGFPADDPVSGSPKVTKPYDRDHQHNIARAWRECATLTHCPSMCDHQPLECVTLQQAADTSPGFAILAAQHARSMSYQDSLARMQRVQDDTVPWSVALAQFMARRQARLAWWGRYWPVAAVVVGMLAAFKVWVLS